MIKENTPTLHGERIVLRKMRREDVENMYELLKDEEVNTYLPWFCVTSIEETLAFIEKRFLAHYEDELGYHYAICLRENDHCIGYIQLGDEEPYDFGYGIHKQYWHKGYAQEAAKLLINHIQLAGFRYVSATHDVNNPRSGEVMKALGMKYQYSYKEQWMPKNRPVIFRMYQLNFDNSTDIYEGYKQKYEYFIEEL